MVRRFVLLLVVVITFVAEAGLAMECDSGGKSFHCGLEWSNYGLNFEWYRNSKLVKALELSSKQEEEISVLMKAAAQGEAMGKEISAKEARLREQCLCSFYSLKNDLFCDILIP